MSDARTTKIQTTEVFMSSTHDSFNDYSVYKVATNSGMELLVSKKTHIIELSSYGNDT